MYKPCQDGIGHDIIAYYSNKQKFTFSRQFFSIILKCIKNFTSTKNKIKSDIYLSYYAETFMKKQCKVFSNSQPEKKHKNKCVFIKGIYLYIAV